MSPVKNKLTISVVVSIFLMFIVMPAGAAEPDLDAFARQGRAITDQFMTSLTRRCELEIETIGVHAANAVCRLGYQQMYYEFSVKNKIIMNLVSLTPRNVVSAHPDYWEQAGLLSMEKAIRNGEDPGTMEIVELVEEPAATYYRYLSPLVATPFCLQCHGKHSKVDPDVTTWVGELYPNDEAMGYEVGDFMGAVSIKKEYSPGKQSR